MTDHAFPSAAPSRRAFLAGSAALAAATLAGCGTATPSAISPTSRPVRDTEARRRRAGARVHDVSLRAAPASLDLGGVTVASWFYGGRLPGREIRVRAGDLLRVRLSNALPAPTSIHWHGVALRNDMDGVPGLTQQAVSPGGTFTYEFTVPDPGTYWFHPHVGPQLDRGLYAPLIVEDPAEPGRYDDEWVVVLDDWLDGLGRDPDSVLRDLKAGGTAGNGTPGEMPGMDHGGIDHGGMDHGGMHGGAAATPVPSVPVMPHGGHMGGSPYAGDVTYPYYLINGRTPRAPLTFRGRPGSRVRIRLINAAGDTVFRVALGGHRLTVTHTDGFPVEPVVVGNVIVGMGERVDVTVQLRDGVFPLVAMAEGKNAAARAVVRAGSGATPPADASPVELSLPARGAADLVAAPQVRLGERKAARRLDVRLGGTMMPYRWTINDRTFGDHVPLSVQPGERVVVRFDNTTQMSHPMHVHGHTLQLLHGPGPGPRKDTMVVPPGQTLEALLAADNPGQWMVHCHNIYHAEAGMMTVLSYRR